MHRRLVLPVLLLSIGPLLSPAPSISQSGASGYRVGPRDLVAIRVFEEPKLNVELRVSNQGTIDLPLLGELSVEGLTAEELSARLRQVLESELLQHASVSVQIREFRSRPISVIGAVRQPGNLEFSGRWTLLEALTEAGGVADNHGDFVYILRRAENGLSDQLRIDLRDLLVAADPLANVPIFANDVINVSSAVQYTVYTIGELQTPGAISFRSTERMTLLSAIAKAGGLGDRAGKKILVRRRAAGGEEEFRFNYRDLLAGREPDFELQDGDLVIVKESFF